MPRKSHQAASSSAGVGAFDTVGFVEGAAVGVEDGAEEGTAVGTVVGTCVGTGTGIGVGRGDTVGVIAGNRVEWAVCAYAVYGLGARYAPMYEHQLAKDWEYILDDSDAKLVIVSSAAIYAQVEPWCGKLGRLEHVVGMDLPGDDDTSLASVRARGLEAPCEPAAIDPSDICGFIYTSGTTGNPKGVLLSHSNIVSNINAVHSFMPMQTEDMSLAFLPWAHSFGQTCELHCLLSMGAATAFAESIPKLVENLAEVKPTILFAVPRIFNQIYDAIQKKVNAGVSHKFNVMLRVVIAIFLILVIVILHYHNMQNY